ncbi:MFS transporter [Streptomyces sp. NPDC005921]
MVATPAYDPPTASSGIALATPQRHTGTILAGCLAVCLAQIGLVLPAAINGVIQRSLQASGSELTWISDAFLVPAAVLALTFGVVGDLYGRRKLVVGASLLAAIGYLVSATAGSAAQLITGQAISGIGAAALFPASLTMITAVTTTPAERAKGLASWTTALSLGALVAPLLSGGIVEHASFQWAFGVTGVIAVGTAGAAWLLAAESTAPEGRSLDWPGQITIALALLSLLYGIIQGPSDGWGSAPIVLSFTGFVVLLAAFVVMENRSAAPMLRLELFRIRAFAASAAMAVIGMFGFLGGAYDLSIRLGVIQHQSPFQAAVPFVVIQGITPFIWPLLVRLLHRVGPGPMLVTGFVSLLDEFEGGRDLAHEVVRAAVVDAEIRPGVEVEGPHGEVLVLGGRRRRVRAEHRLVLGVQADEVGAGELVGHVTGVVGAAVGVSGPVGGPVRRGAGTAGVVLVGVDRAHRAGQLHPAVRLPLGPVEHRHDLRVGRGDLRVRGRGRGDHQVVRVDPCGAGTEDDLQPVACLQVDAADGVAGVGAALRQLDRTDGLAVAPDRVRTAGPGAADPRGEVVTAVAGSGQSLAGPLPRTGVEIEKTAAAVDVPFTDPGTGAEGPAHPAILETRVRQRELGGGGTGAGRGDRASTGRRHGRQRGGRRHEEGHGGEQHEP